MRFCTTPEGVRIAYTTFGQGPPLVFANGCWLSTSHDLDERYGGPFYKAISERYTVVCYDRRGTGLSDRNRTDFSLGADLLDLETLVNHLGLERFALFGNCALGSAAIAYAARHPQVLTRLILYAAWAHGPSLTRDDIKTSFITMARSHWGIASRTISDMFVPESEGGAAERIAQAMRESCEGDVAARFLEMMYATDVTDLLAHVDVPTLVLNRQHDRGVPFRMARELASCLPNARLVSLDGMIHLFWYGNWGPFVAAVDEFLQEERSQTLQEPLPSGTAIILFADIVDSTALTERLGDDAIRENGGSPVEGKTLGDGVLAVFTSAKQAIACAQACHDAADAMTSLCMSASTPATSSTRPTRTGAVTSTAVPSTSPRAWRRRRRPARRWCPAPCATWHARLPASRSKTVASNR
jgi:pimeloyl-ACP methyl ester carboxylesterase